MVTRWIPRLCAPEPFLRLIVIRVNSFRVHDLLLAISGCFGPLPDAYRAFVVGLQLFRKT
jgi:hypothetical protein